MTEAHETQERNEKELKAAAAKNQILSELTKMLYSYNLTLNLRTGKYNLIVGTGMTKFMEIFKTTDDYAEAYNEKLKYLDPETKEQFTSLASLEALHARRNANGFTTGVNAERDILNISCCIVQQPYGKRCSPDYLCPALPEQGSYLGAVACRHKRNTVIA